MATLKLSEGFALSPVERTDRHALVEHLQAREIARNTLHIPYPYTLDDANAWGERRTVHRENHSAATTFALRYPEGTLVGVVGADDLEVGTTHRANVGYRLATPYWNRGLMTEALGRSVEPAFGPLGLARLTAEVFPWNPASRRVLETAGVRFKERPRNHRDQRRAGGHAPLRPVAGGHQVSRNHEKSKAGLEVFFSQEMGATRSTAGARLA